MSAPRALLAALLVLTCLVPIVFRRPASTLANTADLSRCARMLALEGSATGSDSSAAAILACGGIELGPDQTPLPPCRTGSWRLFPFDIETVVFATDSSVLASISSPAPLRLEGMSADGYRIRVASDSDRRFVLAIGREGASAFALSLLAPEGATR